MFNNLKKISWPNFWLWAGIITLTLLLHLNHGLNPDEGVVLNGAWNLFNDKELYSDFYEFVSPGSFYLVFFVWKIFGVSFLAAKFLSIACLFFGIIGLHKISKLIIKNKTITFLILLSFIIISCWWPLINHNIFNLIFLIWACYFLIKGLINFKNINFLISGLLTGVSILFLQQKGVTFLIFSFLFLATLFIIFRKRIYLRFSLTYFLASLPPLLLLCFWPIKTVFYNLVKYPMFGYVTVNKISYNLLIASFIIWLIFLGVLFFKKEKTVEIWFLMAAQFGLLLTTYPLPDLYHISVVMFPLLLIAFYFVNEEFVKPTKVVVYLFMVFLLVILYPLFIFNLTTDKFSLITWKSSANYKIIEYINYNCSGRYLYAGPFAPSFYFETRKLNATPYSVLITRQQSPAQFQEALMELKKNKPDCVVLSYPDSLLRFKHDQNNQVEEYFKNNYKLVYQPTKSLFVYKNVENNW